MSQQHDGGPAFPIAPVFHAPGLGLEVWTTATAHPGMSLRDWFAGQALAGMLAYSSAANDNPSYAAHWAYQAADAILAEREKATP